MIDLDSSITDEFEAGTLFPCNLVVINLSSTVYFTDLDRDIYYNGNWYLARGMDLPDVLSAISPSRNRLNFEMDNTNLEWEGFDAAQELRGKTVTVYMAVLDANSQVIGVTVRFLGIINSMRIRDSDKKAAIEVKSHLYRWNSKTLREHSPTCPWVFKDTTCGYSGAETQCDRTYDRCIELINEARFGGHPFLLLLQEKKFWWGRVPKE